MKTPRLLAGVCGLLILSTLASQGLRAGLYDDDAKTVTTGDLNSQDYWWTKFDIMMLDLALKQKQPEGKIGLNLASTKNRIDDLIKAYPNHEGIKKWKTHVDEVLAKISPDAPRGADWNPDPVCPWDEANFAQLWVNFNWAKLCVDQKDWNRAAMNLSNVEQNYEFMLRPDRMKHYPDDLRKWVEDNKPVADKMYADVKAHKS